MSATNSLVLPKYVENQRIVDQFEAGVIDHRYFNQGSFQCDWTETNPANKTFDTGTLAVHTVTFDTFANTTDGEWFGFYEEEEDGSETLWAFALDKTGSTVPTDPNWLAIPGANKVIVDISGATSGADIAALVETDVDGLSGIGVVTDDSAADGTMTFTQIVPGVVTAPTVVEEDGGGSPAGSWATTTPGVATEVDVANNLVSIPSHGYETGTKCQLTTTGTLPAGLATSTDYYIYKSDDDNIGFATSQANALAGTLVDITGFGATTSVHTVAVETTLDGIIKLQMSNDRENWETAEDESGGKYQETITDGSGSLFFNLHKIPWRFTKLVVDIDESELTLNVKHVAKGGI